MTLEFIVPDMACGVCANKIEQAVKAIDPTAEITADPTSKVVKISTTTDATGLKPAIEQAGYHPQPAAR